MAQDRAGEPLVIRLSGRIDSNNAGQVEQSIKEQLGGRAASVALDMEALEYISSAGLRVILHLRKNCRDLKIVNVSSVVYDILEMTGFTEMMPVEKAYRVVSVEGCEEIGRGANGTIYRIDQDNVVKVYRNADALAEIRHEREVAKQALILGIPTAISYDVVKVGDSYGSVFELLNAKSFSEILAADPGKLDWCVEEYVKLLKLIHGTLVPAGKLPDMKETALSWTRFLQDYLPEAAAAKLQALVEAIPHDDHMLHGDYHTKNLELQNDEVLLIDMDTLSVGHPIFELASIYNAFVGFYELDRDLVRRFHGFDFETAETFWKKFLAAYLETTCPTKLREVEDKARLLGYARLIRRSIRRKGLETESGRAEIAYWKEELLALLEKTDTLLFSAGEMEIDALPEKLDEVQAFIDDHLKGAAGPKESMQIALVAEEVFINIASYAYAPDTGKAVVRVQLSEAPSAVTITFSDRGTPYDPLARKDPNIALPAEEREVGGLGVYMTKKLMDDVHYEYKDGRNILTMTKNL